MVNIWRLSDSRNRGTVKLKQPLYGHTAPVLCLAVSSAFNILVSGSCDKTCIVWDLSRLRYVTQLSEHKAPVAAISINNLSGVIATCASSWLYIWSVNGEPLASVDTAGNGAGPLQINCVAMSQANEWDSNNVIMTGSSDGVVRMYSLDLVKQPRATRPAPSPPTERESITQSKSLSLDKSASTDSSPNKSFDSSTLKNGASDEYVDLTSASLNSPHSSPAGNGSASRPVPAAR